MGVIHKKSSVHLVLDAIVFCFAKQNSCKSLKIYIVFNLQNMNALFFMSNKKLSSDSI